MPFPRPPEKIVAFRNGAVAPHDLERQFDEHRRSVSNVIDFLRTIVRDDGVVKNGTIGREQLSPELAARSVGRAGVLGSSPAPPLPTGVLGPNAGGFFAADDDGATATSADYAQVCIDWAEHMPDTIPLQTLAVNAITGDHWSARWWANQAARLVSVLMQGGAGIFAEQVAVTSTNTLAALTNAPVDATTTMQLIVAGRVFSGCVSPRPFTVAAKIVTWAYGGLTLHPGDEVVARYRAAVTSSSPTGNVQVASLYYIALAAQSSFLLSTADRFGTSYTLDAGSKVQVTRGGVRLMPVDGSGQGAYTVAGNSILLSYPAGAGETIIVDIWE
jgi:hypothetical protein